MYSMRFQHATKQPESNIADSNVLKLVRHFAVACVRRWCPRATASVATCDKRRRQKVSNLNAPEMCGQPGTQKRTVRYTQTEMISV